MHSQHPLKRFREKKGWSARELARFLGVAPNTVSRWECGQQRIAGSLVAKISKLTGISIAELAAAGVPLEAAE